MPWYERPLPQIVLARMKEFTREPEVVFWVCGFPIVMVLALGLAFRSQPVERINVDVATDDPAVETIVAALEKDPRMVLHRQTAAVGAQCLRTAKTDLFVVSKSAQIGLSEKPTGEATYFYHYDPARPESKLARAAVDDVLQRAAGRKDTLAVTDDLQVEPGGRYIDFLVPGLLGMSLMGGGLWGVGFVTVDMRIRKLLKRFLATPMKKHQFLGGIMLGRLLFLVPEVLILLIFSWLVFDVRVAGSYLELFVLILLGSLTFSGIGLLVASRANTIETVSGLMNLVMVPMWIFSGIFFSPERYPDWMQPFIQALPLTALNTLLRTVMQEGNSILGHTGELAVLLVWGTVSFALALRLFRWT
ncbi:MAG: ABC transporter permease [Pirellulales bacterium]